jgi:transglutaminase-like putative cysteine protease
MNTPGLLTRARAGLTRDKSDTLLLLTAALMVLAPHFMHLPLWVSLTSCVTLLWRARITLQGKRMPPLWLLLPVSIIAMAGVYRSFHTLLGRDAGVAMLALLLTFKLLEMHARRDLFVVIFLSLFLLLTNFFYSQTLLTAAAMMVTLTVLLTAQMSFQYTGAVPPLLRRLRAAATVVLLAAPLALLMFIGFPRLQGPLWGLPGDAHSAHTGMTDTMAPGSVSALATSDELAFRVRFKGPVPDQSQLYWRGIVLSDYDGRTWTRINRRRLPRERIQIQAGGAAISHEITLEPTGKRWLFALELSGPDLDIPGQTVNSSNELEFSTYANIGERLRYDTHAWLSFRIQANATPEQLQPWLALPAGFNPRTLELARQLRQPSGLGSSQAVLEMFRKQPFSYTLEPPLLGRDAVDDFLFSSRAGFCEHYAGAYVVLMRAIGVPARVVTGYQGGELNPIDGYLSVRQSDAHAWAEIWLPGAGWKRVDPTGAVAPERIRSNLAHALPQKAPFGFTPLLELENDPHSWLAQLRFQVAALNNAWNQWVLDYNPDRQRSFLEELGAAFGHPASMAGLALAAGLIWWWQRRRSQVQPDPLDALYQAFCRQQMRYGVTRAAHEGPLSYAARLRAVPASSEKRAAMEQFLDLYGALKYGVAGSASQHRRAGLQKLKTLLPLCR